MHFTIVMYYPHHCVQYNYVGILYYIHWFTYMHAATVLTYRKFFISGTIWNGLLLECSSTVLFCISTGMHVCLYTPICTYVMAVDLI